MKTSRRPRGEPMSIGRALGSLVRLLVSAPIVTGALLALCVIVVFGWLMDDNDDSYGGEA